MTQTTAKVSGMACSMCEAQINDTIRTAFPIEKVSSSHSQGETVIHSKEPLNENTLRAAIEELIRRELSAGTDGETIIIITRDTDPSTEPD